MGLMGALRTGTGRRSVGIGAALRGATVGIAGLGLSAGTIGVLDKIWTSLLTGGGIGLSVGNRGGIRGFARTTGRLKDES